MTELIRERPLTSGQAASAFSVAPKTATRWTRGVKPHPLTYERTGSAVM